MFKKFISKMKKAFSWGFSRRKTKEAPIASEENIGLSVSSGLKDSEHLVSDNVKFEQQNAQISFLELSSKDECDWIIVTKDEQSHIQSLENARETSATSEFMARDVAYKLAVPVQQNSEVASQQLEALKQNGYEVYPISSENLSDKGIFIYGLVNTKDSSSPLYVVSRGTAFDASIIQDLDPQGPGYSCVQENRDYILWALDELATTHGKTSICLTGHSLGGALSQLIGTEILLAKAQPEKKFETIKEISFSVFQSANVNDSVIELATDSVQKIKSKDSSFHVSLTSHVKQGDFVSRTGGTLFADVGPEVADVVLDMRCLNKPLLNLTDCQSIAATVIGSSISPVGLAACIVDAGIRRYVHNRLEAHTDRFFADGQQSYKLQSVYSNRFESDKPYIRHIFMKNDRVRIPLHDEISSYLFYRLKDMPTQDFIAGIGVGVQMTQATLTGLQSAHRGISYALKGNLIGAAQELYAVRDAITVLDNNKDMISVVVRKSSLPVLFSNAADFVKNKTMQTLKISR